MYVCMHACMYVCVYVCMCVCVNHLNRCKTSTCYRCRFGFLDFLNVWNQEISFGPLYQQGDGEDIWGSIQRSSSYDPRISPGTPGDVPASISSYGDRLSQEPAWRFNLISCMVVTICIILFQQEQPLDFPSLQQPGVWSVRTELSELSFR